MHATSDVTNCRLIAAVEPKKIIHCNIWLTLSGGCLVADWGSPLRLLIQRTRRRRAVRYIDSVFWYLDYHDDHDDHDYLTNTLICKRCSFECDMGKYSTRFMNKV